MEKAASPRRARPLLAAVLMVTAGALLVGGCVVAARVGGAWGTATALLGFVSYLVVFARGLDQLPLDWHSWRERDYKEFLEEAGERDDRSEGDNGGRP